MEQLNSSQETSTPSLGSNRKGSLSDTLVANQACSVFLPFAAVARTQLTTDEIDARDITNVPEKKGFLSDISFLWPPPAKSMDKIDSQNQENTATPCCKCPRTLEGDCRRLRGWEKNGYVHTLQQEQLYEALACLLEKRVYVPCICTDGNCRRNTMQHDYMQHKRGLSHIDAIKEGEESEWVHLKCNDAVAMESTINAADAAEEKVHYISKSICELLIGSNVYNSIELDIHRTFPSVEFFRKDGQIAMRRILQTFAIFDPNIGYVQGMNFLVGALLYHSNTSVHFNAPSLLKSTNTSAGASGCHFELRTRQSRVFWLFVSLFYLYDLRRLYLPSLPGVFERCDALERILTEEEGDLLNHLRDCGVSLPLLASDWLLTLFSYCVPLPALSLIWTQFFEEGWLFIYKLTIARLKRMKAQIMESYDIVQLVTVAKHSPAPARMASIGGAVLSWIAQQVSVHSGRDGSVAGQFINSISNSSFHDSPKNTNSVSNDPNAPGSGESWAVVIDDALEVAIDRSKLISLEMDTLSQQSQINLTESHPQVREKDSMWSRIDDAYEFLSKHQPKACDAIDTNGNVSAEEAGQYHRHLDKDSKLYHPLIYADQTIDLLKRQGRDDLAKECADICHKVYSHQKLLLESARRKQHLEYLAHRLLNSPSRLPESLSHWMSDNILE